jgi:hypothetical protein
MSEAPLPDLTCVLVDTDAHDDASVRAVVAAGGYGDGWLRVRPLERALGLTQVELLDAGGLPRIDPALVAALSDRDRRAVFVHVNHQAKQALVHRFVAAKEIEGWLGDPAQLDEKLKTAIGRTLAEVLAADDGTRRGFGQAASSTAARSAGRWLAVPPGTPTALGSFGFHDRGERQSADRVAVVAFDPDAVRIAWSTAPGIELAARVRSLPANRVGPLGGVRERAIGALAALGDATPAAAKLEEVTALELVALTETCFFGGGESVAFVDQRVLPLFSLSSGDPAIDDDEEAAELEARASVLEAMGEVLPYASPEGSLMEQIDDGELSPLAPWARPGEEYVGSLFRLDGARLHRLLTDTDGRALAARIDRFYRAWWRAGHEAPLGSAPKDGGGRDAFEEWRAALDARGAADVERFLAAWAEWRALLGLAAANGLKPALLFYALEGEAG